MWTHNVNLVDCGHLLSHHSRGSRPALARYRHTIVHCALNKGSAIPRLVCSAEWQKLFWFDLDEIYLAVQADKFILIFDTRVASHLKLERQWSSNFPNSLNTELCALYFYIDIDFPRMMGIFMMDMHLFTHIATDRSIAPLLQAVVS